MTVTWPFISDLETMIDTAFHFSNFENKYFQLFRSTMSTFNLRIILLTACSRFFLLTVVSTRE